MKRYQIIFLMFFFVLWLGACNSSSSHSSSANSENTVANNEQPSQDNQEQLPDPTVDPFSANGLTIIDQVCVDEDTGYLAEDVNGKQYLVLQGSPASIGFQVGFLMPEGTYKMTKEYAFKVLEAMLGVSYEESPRIYEFLKEEILTLCNYAIEKNAIPGYLLEEMQGVAAGALMRGYDVAFEDVLILNLGYDALYSILFTGTLPSMSGLQRLLGEIPGIQDYIRIEDTKVFFPNAGELMGCNEFVISGSAAEDNKVFHGRDFMFITGGIYENYACMSVYLPDDGYPFVASSSPGFVGQTTSLNSQGLSMGMDVVYGACTRSDPGLGCLMVLRDIVQNCSNLDEAVNRMKNQDRGVSWLYILADDEWSDTYTNGIVVEEGMSYPDFSGPDLLPQWEQILLSPYIERLDEEPLPDKGIMYRNQEWIYPAEFRGLTNQPFGVGFPDQIETWPDVVMTTNHYIIPRMVFTRFTPWISFISNVDNPCTRYDWLFGHMAEEFLAADDGRLDFADSKRLIDFLNPNSPYGDHEYYLADGPVRGHHDIIDNQELVMESLFGFYGPDPKHMTPWARIDLKPFAATLQ